MVFQHIKLSRNKTRLRADFRPDFRLEINLFLTLSITGQTVPGHWITRFIA